MSEKTTVEITCDKCGSDIDPGSVFWRAMASGNRNPEFGMTGGTPLEPDWIPNEDLPNTLDFCSECVPGMFGDLIWKVAKERRAAKNPAPEREPGGVSDQRTPAKGPR